MSENAPTPAADFEAALLPCPFCGGDAEEIYIEEEGDNFGGSVISCKQCSASTAVHFDRKENLHSSWNDRQRPADKPAAADDDATYEQLYVEAKTAAGQFAEQLAAERTAHLAAEAERDDYAAEYFARLRKLEAAEAANERLEKALRDCRDKFVYYAALHRRKMTKEGDRKFAENMKMAGLCDAALAAPKAEAASTAEVADDEDVAIDAAHERRQLNKGVMGEPE
jgi:Lar family restriction alleviation protein